MAKLRDGIRTNYLWDGMALLEETAGSEKIEYLFMPGSFFPMGMTRGGAHYSFVFDQLLAPCELLAMDGTIAWAADYWAFGEIRRLRVSTVDQPIRFLGQYFDPESSLCYNRYRYYDPLLGRYTTPDPIGFEGGTNLYAYGPNPINWVDPLGLQVCDIQPKCSWNKKQQEDAKKKARASNKQIDKLGNGKGVPIPPPCDNRKNAKTIYDKCRANGSPLPPLKETSSKCSNQQADHILEVCAGGPEDKCSNLQPLNESVNKSFGSQMKACAAKLQKGRTTAHRHSAAGHVQVPARRQEVS